MKARVGFLCALLALALNAGASTDIFLKLEGVLGESQKVGHQDEIEILSWSFGMSNPGSLDAGGGGGAGKVTMQDLSLTKFADSSSPVLMLSTASGRHHRQAILTLQAPGEKPFVYYRITLDDVVVTSVQTGGSTGESRPTESLSLNFAKIKVEYIPQKADGTPGPAVVFTWDLALNKP